MSQIYSCWHYAFRMKLLFGLGLVVALSLLPGRADLAGIVKMPGAIGRHARPTYADESKPQVVIDLTDRIEHSSRAVSVPGFSIGGVPGEKPLDDSLPIRLSVEYLESKGKQILRVYLVNQSEQSLVIPVSLRGAASPEAQKGSTSFLFSIVLSAPGSDESFSRPLVSSSNSDPRHSEVILPQGGQAVILLPLPAYIFRAKDVKVFPELMAHVSLSEIKIKKEEYKTESIRKAQSVNAVALLAAQIAELGRRN